MSRDHCVTCGTTEFGVKLRADGQVTCCGCVNCWYGMTIHRGRNAGAYATRKQAGAAVLRELRAWRSRPGLGDTAGRVAAASRIMAADHRQSTGEVVTGWARRVAMDEALGGP